MAVVAVFAAVLLVACGAKSDNGTYVYKPSKTEVKEILEEQGAPSSSVDALIDNVKLEVSVTIKDKTGSLKIKVNDGTKDWPIIWYESWPTKENSSI